MSAVSSRLVHDALLVMEKLEPTAGAEDNYRAALVDMVTKSCEQDGRRHSREAIEQAIDSIGDQLNLPQPLQSPVAPTPTWRQRRRLGWQAFLTRVRRPPRPARPAWPAWLASRVTRFLAQSMGISALAHQFSSALDGAWPLRPANGRGKVIAKVLRAHLGVRHGDGRPARATASF